MATDVDKIRASKLAIAAAIEVANTGADRQARLDGRRKDMGMRQLGRIYLHQETIAELDWLAKEWGMRNRSQVLDIAVRRLHQQTKEGLQRLDFADGLPTKRG